MRSYYESQIQQLYAIETRLLTIIQKTGDAMVIIDHEGIIQFVNPSAEALFKQPSKKLIGIPFEYPIVIGKITEFEMAQPDGEVTIAEMQVVEIEWVGAQAYLATLRDHTERKELEKRLLQGQNMESIGLDSGAVNIPASSYTIRDGVSPMISENMYLNPFMPQKFSEKAPASVWQLAIPSWNKITATSM
ncbi:MAG: PAS domain S-box protein [Gemmatimonadota bacterium]|nr:PAS domain S-box protein [Gemmatimonadota bacterium]